MTGFQSAGPILSWQPAGLCPTPDIVCFPSPTPPPSLVYLSPHRQSLLSVATAPGADATPPPPGALTVIEVREKKQGSDFSPAWRGSSRYHTHRLPHITRWTQRDKHNIVWSSWTETKHRWRWGSRRWELEGIFSPAWPSQLVEQHFSGAAMLLLSHKL